jgi:hypothetical protein
LLSSWIFCSTGEQEQERFHTRGREPREASGRIEGRERDAKRAKVEAVAVAAREEFRKEKKVTNLKLSRKKEKN